MGKKPWSNVEMTIYILLTVIIPPVGLILGFINLGSSERKKQAWVLLAVAVVAAVLHTYRIPQMNLL